MADFHGKILIFLIYKVLYMLMSYVYFYFLV